MRRSFAAIGIAILALSASLGYAAQSRKHAAAKASPEDAAFGSLAARYIDGIARIDPSAATALGDHRFDDQVTDMSGTGRQRAIVFYRETLAELARIDRGSLNRDNQVDAALLDNALRYALWTRETLQSWAWDPQIYTETAGSSLYSLAARDFAPWDVRLKAATARMEALPRLFAQARENMVPERVPAIFATTVAKQNAGIVSLAEEALLPHRDVLGASDARRFDAALARLQRESARHQQWLDTVLVPRAKGDFRLGPTLYDTKLRFTLMSPLDRTRIKERALRAVETTRADMYALARQALAGRADAPSLPAAPTPAQQQKAIEAALELSYAHQPSRETLTTKAAETLRETSEFVRNAGLMTMPSGPIRIITTPKFQQGVAVAYCDSPGPLDRTLDTFYMVSPIPADWTADQVRSYLREYNDYMIQDLTIHEAMPGHYLQIAHGNRHPSILRSVLSSGPFIEGWAVYAEGLMAEAGYLDGDPLFRLTVLKMRLRSITNALLDIGIHTEGMTRDRAMALMMQTAFQQEREAAGKWVRASLGSTQLPSYFVGYSEHVALREEARRRRGAAFSLKDYHDDVLSHGSPPTRFVRALMFGEAIDPN